MTDNYYQKISIIIINNKQIVQVELFSPLSPLLQCSIRYILNLYSLHLMGRTIPHLEQLSFWRKRNGEKFRKYLRNKNEKKLFTHMFSIAKLYNSASSNTVNPIRIYPIMMSILLHHYKTLKENIFLLTRIVVLLLILRRILIIHFFLKEKQKNGITILLF